MIYDVQKASILKRISAYLLDAILVCILAVGICYVLSLVLDLNTSISQLNDLTAEYEAKYGVDFDTTLEVYENFTPEQKENFDNAYEAMLSDERFAVVYRIFGHTILMLSLGFFVSIFVFEFVVPLVLGNGQTIGKRIFAVGVMHGNGVKIKTPFLFARAILGKYTVETMIPVCCVLMFFFTSYSLMALVVLVMLALLQLVLVIASQNNTLIHDAISFTVCVDMKSQMIFENEDEKVAYIADHAKDGVDRSREYFSPRQTNDDDLGEIK